MATLAWFAIALLLMLVGLAGAVLPLLPGLPLVLAGVYLYALATGLAAGVGLGHLVVYTLIGGAAILLSSLANLWGVRAAGDSRAGVLGAMLGLLVGLVLGGPIGLLVGPFVGRSPSSCWPARPGGAPCAVGWARPLACWWGVWPSWRFASG